MEHKRSRKNSRSNKVKSTTDATKETDDKEIDKPWITYLRNLRIPMLCQLHRKITVTIAEFALRATPPQNK